MEVSVVRCALLTAIYKLEAFYDAYEFTLPCSYHTAEEDETHTLSFL